MNFGRRARLRLAPNASVLSALCLLTVAGCAETSGIGPPAAVASSPSAPPPAAAAPRGIVIQAPFNAEEFAWSVKAGTARIQGLTAQGASCAGKAVALTPATPYSRERIQALYGSTDYAVLPMPVVRAKIIANDNPAMRGYVRGARCDAKGAFLFEKLPAGPYFIIAEVDDPAGPKVIMRRVTAVSGRTLQTPMNGPAPAR